MKLFIISYSIIISKLYMDFLEGRNEAETIQFLEMKLVYLHSRFSTN